MLEFRNVSYVYSLNTPFERRAVDDISFCVENNETVGIIGHTGSGKSTLAQLANALLSPTSGQVLLDGENIHESKEKKYASRFRVGLVFQYPEYQLFEETVERDIAFGPKNMGLSDSEIAQRVEYAAHFTGLSREILQKSPFELSGGQKRRVAIAGVIAMEPQVLILDEPAAGLDPKGKEEILGGLCEYKKIKNNSLVIISHSMEDVARYSDKILALSSGRKLAFGTPSEVFSHASELEKSGLSLPEITKILHELKKEDSSICDSHFFVEPAVEELKGKLKKR